METHNFPLSFFEEWFSIWGFFIALLYTLLLILPEYGSSSNPHCDPSIENDYLMDELELEKHRVKILKENKKNSLWLVVDNQYIMHRNDTSPDGSQYYWECSHRRKTADCRYVQFHSNCL